MTAAKGTSKGLHIGLWFVQILLAVAFGMAGFMKTTMPFDALNKAMPWTLVVGEPGVRFIGASELAGALGLLLPSITRILPILTPLAGVGLTTVMVLASAFHASRGELGVLPINFVLGSLAAFVAWGRFRRAPIAARASDSAGTAATV
jgi:hypothetical protein